MKISDREILAQQIHSTGQSFTWGIFFANEALRRGQEGAYEDYFQKRRAALLKIKNLPASLKLLVADESLLCEFFPEIFKISEMADFLLRNPHAISLEQQLLDHEFWQD